MNFPATVFFAVFCLSSVARAQETTVDFAHEVLPLLKAKCVKCHTNGKYKGSFSMDTRATILESENVILGKSGESELMARVLSDDPDERMPPKGDALKAEEVAVLKRWIDGGLAWEDGFSFREATWKSPVKPRRVELPEGNDTLNPIDRLVLAYFKKQNVKPPRPVNDAALVRRLYLDVLGILPEPDAVAAFAADASPDKHEKLVEDLLGRRLDYADHWMTLWNDLLRNDYAGTGFIDGGRKQISKWLYQSLRENTPYDAFVRGLIDASPESEGFIRGIKWRGNVNASQVQEVQFAQSISQVFLGENMKCASCHDSFINDWKLADAYGLAAIVADKPIEMHRCDKPTGKMAEAKFLFPELGAVDPKAPKNERLKQTAALMTSKDNGRFARTVVNRYWQRLMGRGLVEPVDIMGNRPWDEDLLDYLGVWFADSGYDLKKLIALITTSRTYRSEIVPGHDGPPEEYVFRGPEAKRMTAEQFVDAVWSITGTKPKKIDAPVERSDSTGEKGVVSLGGSFIWMTADKSRHQAGEEGVFTKTFDLKLLPKKASVVITCDNEYVLSVNGREIGRDDDWMAAEAYNLAGVLRKGRNEISVKGRNGGSGPNAAGLFCAVVLDDSKVIATDATWLANGKPAVVLGDRNAWGAPLGGQMQALASSGDIAGVRASLVNSTLLMRALGRPNREQIVTTRPADLSTLQALDLNNGREFVMMLEAGAKGLIRDHKGNAGAITDAIFQKALSRPPDAGERGVAMEILGSASEETVADLLWLVLMLPEFQVVG